MGVDFMNSEKLDLCPKQSGTFIAYEAEWRFGNDKWQTVPSVFNNDPHGVPFPRLNGVIGSAIGLMGHAQAQAVAWGYAAHAAAQGQDMDVKVQPYEVIYDIQARKVDLSAGQQRPVHLE